MNKKKTSLLLFDESTGDDYKAAFEKNGAWKVILTTRQRRATGRKRFDDPEIFNIGEYKYTVVTRDCVMTGDALKPYKKAGKIILRQPDKSKGERKEEYMNKISKYMIYQTSFSTDFHGKITLIPVTKPIISLKWDAFIKRFPTKDRIYEYENH